MPASRPKHPDKAIEAALRQLEARSWSVERSKGRSAHAWGFVLCPANAGAECRGGVFCRMSVWSTPRTPERHARNLLRQAEGCVMTEGGDER